MASSRHLSQPPGVVRGGSWYRRRRPAGVGRARREGRTYPDIVRMLIEVARETARYAIANASRDRGDRPRRSGASPLRLYERVFARSRPGFCPHGQAYAPLRCAVRSTCTRTRSGTASGAGDADLPGPASGAWVPTSPIPTHECRSRWLSTRPELAWPPNVPQYLHESAILLDPGTEHAICAASSASPGEAWRETRKRCVIEGRS
jgi:hypothetical protein